MFSQKTNSEFSLHSYQSQSCLFIYHYLFSSKQSYWLNKNSWNSEEKNLLKDVVNSTLDINNWHRYLIKNVLHDSRKITCYIFYQTMLTNLSSSGRNFPWIRSRCHLTRTKQSLLSRGSHWCLRLKTRTTQTGQVCCCRFCNLYPVCCSPRLLTISFSQF